MSKPLTQLVPDLREALEKGLEEAAEKVVADLQEDGPYWTGFFADMWQINAGNVAIKANIKSMEPAREKPKQPRDYITVTAPDSPNLNGYTIGNRAEYRLYSMDILTDSTRGRGKPGARLTADKNWFDRYVNAKMPAAINTALTNVFRRY